MFKARSERNKRNRDKLKTTHLAGTKTYSKIRYDKRNIVTQTEFGFSELINIVTQTELGFSELYEATHQRSDGTWVHENARIFHENLKQHNSKAVSEGTNLTDKQMSFLTFGRKPGYLSGLGHGPNPTSSATGKKTRSELKREANEAAKRAEFSESTAREARQETVAQAEKDRRPASRFFCKIKRRDEHAICFLPETTNGEFFVYYPWRRQ